MQNKIIKVFAISALSFFLMACDPVESRFTEGNVKGYKPVYASTAETAISFGEARPIQKPGKIYIYGSYLLVNEQQRGIHFFNNSDPSSPIPLGFLKIYGNIDMVIRNNVLYADHLGSLVALNISDLQHITELSRIKTWSNLSPPEGSGHFECVDPKQGEVIGWVVATLQSPQCFK